MRWLGELVGFDAAATGILVSGGSAANLTALLVALRAVTGLGDDRRVMRDYRVQTLAGLLRLWFENSQDSWRDFGPVRR